MFPRAIILTALSLSAPLLAGSAQAGQAKKDILLRSLREELDRSMETLRRAGENELYFLAYQARDTRTYTLASSLGAIESEDLRHYRHLDIDMRVGSPSLDNTHQMKGTQGWWDDSTATPTEITIDDDADALKADIWRRTDRAYKDAQNRLTKVLTNKAVTAEEEDKSADFSEEKSARHYDVEEMPEVDQEGWAKRLRELSFALKPYPFLLRSRVELRLETENRYLVNSEGSEIVTGGRKFRLFYYLESRTEDGTDLDRFRSYDTIRVRDLPSNDKILRDIETSAAELKALHSAPLVTPYSGPAIFRNKATAVFFHEILGHRLEGHRQKLEDEGQTFTKKLGKTVTADFISVYDDPTQERHDGTPLRGFYRYDDEGVEARRVTLIENGVLKGFLLSRSPIAGFPHSNGHGRRSAGNDITARMGNTLVKASKTVGYARLREMLIAEIKKQGKPYGFIFSDIGGGFTNTSQYGAQSFKVLPKLVYRVYPDDRPDETVRGVDIVGTPLNSFNKILAAADDYEIFNGTCGAESGWVPVSGVAPSILFSEIEVEKTMKLSEKPPLLPPPLHDPAGKGEAP